MLERKTDRRTEGGNTVAKMNAEYSIELHNPLTEEEWDSLTDVDMEHTNSVTFNTKHGKEVVFIKVKHGRWIIPNECKTTEQYRCSVCGSNVHVPECMGEPTFRYCPDCGAQMGMEVADVEK